MEKTESLAHEVTLDHGDCRVFLDQEDLLESVTHEFVTEGVIQIWIDSWY